MSEARKTFEMDGLRGRLSEHHYKLTPQRKEILQVFVETPEGEHLSAEDVHRVLSDKNLKFGLATVYRNVELLTSLKILNRVDFNDGRTRYELGNADPNAHHHHHLICLKCKKVIEFEEDLLEDLESDIAEKSDFRIVNHEVKFYGYCSECRS